MKEVRWMRRGAGVMLDGVARRWRCASVSLPSGDVVSSGESIGTRFRGRLRCEPGG